MAAVANDDEVAKRLAATPQDDRSGARGPSLTEWSPEVQQLVLIADTLGSLRALFLNVNGVKVKQPPAQPRPTTALGRQRQHARRARHDQFVSSWVVAPERPE